MPCGKALTNVEKGKNFSFLNEKKLMKKNLKLENSQETQEIRTSY